MKKKEIERIAILTPEKAAKKYKLKMVAAVDGNILICDFFKNIKKNPFVCRVVIAGDDFGTWDGVKWNGKKIRTNHYTGVWNDHTGNEEPYGRTIDDKEIYVSEASRAIIKDYIEQRINKCWSDNWYYQLEYMQDHISNLKFKRMNMRKEEKMNNLMSQVGKIPEEFEKWAKSKLPTGRMYYKIKGSRVELLCSECNVGYSKKIRRDDSFEGMFEDVITKPVVDNYAVCDVCGAIGLYKQRGRCEFKQERIGKSLFMIDALDNDIAVIRNIEIDKWMSPETPATYHFYEKARMVIGPKLQELYWKACEGWSWNNPGYFWNYEKINAGYLWHGGSVDNTFLRYSQIMEWGKWGTVRFNPFKYAACYKKVPELEMVIKLGMDKLAEHLIDYGTNILCEGKTFDEKLGVDKKNLKELIRQEGKTDVLRLMQLERKYNFTMTTEERLKMAEYNYKLQHEVEFILQHMSITKFIHQIEKYIGHEITIAGTRTVRNVMDIYIDYMHMRDRLHHDLDNSVHLFPRELREEHDKLVIEQNKEKDEKYIAEKEGKYGHIREIYKQLYKRYHYETEELSVRPAKSATEIIMEGRLQHHCVGGDNYLKKHNEQTTAILLVRHKEKPNVPYITVEIKGDEIVQWYGIHDTKPDEMQNKEWLDKYTEYLKTGRKTKTLEKQILVAAV